MECVILETVVIICCQRRLGLMLLSGWDGFYDTGVSGIGQSRSFHVFSALFASCFPSGSLVIYCALPFFWVPPFPLAFEGIVPV